MVVTLGWMYFCEPPMVTVERDSTLPAFWAGRHVMSPTVTPLCNHVLKSLLLFELWVGWQLVFLDGHPSTCVLDRHFSEAMLTSRVWHPKRIIIIKKTSTFFFLYPIFLSLCQHCSRSLWGQPFTSSHECGHAMCPVCRDQSCLRVLGRWICECLRACLALARDVSLVPISHVG